MAKYFTVYSHFYKKLYPLLPYKDSTLNTARFPKITKTTSPPVN